MTLKEHDSREEILDYKPGIYILYHGSGDLRYALKSWYPGGKAD